MTESYGTYQNAVAERVNGILKHEFILGIITKTLELIWISSLKKAFIFTIIIDLTGVIG